MSSSCDWTLAKKQRALFRPLNKLVPWLWSKMGNANNAQMRTTFVPTMASMGVALNVVPMHSEIFVDMRNLPGDEGVLPEQFMKRALTKAGCRFEGDEQSNRVRSSYLKLAPHTLLLHS